LRLRGVSREHDCFDRAVRGAYVQRMRLHLHRALLMLALLVTGCATSPTRATALDPAKLVDLSYAFGSDTVYWPTAEPFRLQRVFYGRTAGGYFYAANNISMAEHGGTHMDAPIHFAEGRRTSGEVPLANCVGPAVVIDVRTRCARDADYAMSVDDVRAWEARHGRIPRGAIVIMYSGWGARWPDRKRYLGTDVPLDVDNLHFPGFSREAAEFLVNGRDVAALAIDTASIDPGESKDFIAHRVLNGANKPAFENVANVQRLPPSGATFIALPLKIAGGSGGPARIVALLP
jgi:kynurenine formamidase